MKLKNLNDSYIKWMRKLTNLVIIIIILVSVLYDFIMYVKWDCENCMVWKYKNNLLVLKFLCVLHIYTYNHHFNMYIVCTYCIFAY